MLEQLKKKGIKKSLPTVIILLLIGIGLICLEAANIKALIAGSKEFKRLLPEDIKDHVMVDASIDVNFGCYMEEYEENTKTHITRSTYNYYVIWTGDDYAEDYRYMGIKVPHSDEKTMEAMAEAYFNYESFEPVQYSGMILKMPDEDYKYFKEYFIESGWSEEEFLEGTLPYYINASSLSGSGSIIPVYVISGIGVVLIIIAMIILIRALCGSNLKELQKELAANGLSAETLDFEYENAALLDKGSNLKMGSRYTFFMIGSKPHIIVNDKIVWAYQKSTTHRTNGIPTGTTYEIAVGTYDRMLSQIPVAKEAVVQDILQRINQTMPWTVIGYSDELNKMFRTNYQEFLNLRYNQEKQV